MSGLSKKNMAIVVSVTLIALVFLVTLPNTAYALSPVVSASQDGLTARTRILRAKGIALDDQKEKIPANFTLVLMPDKINRRTVTFNITNGTLEVNGVKYAITEGKGFVQYYSRVIALKVKGIGPQGQTVTLKLAGRYFWMWGYLHVARILGTLQIGNTKLQLRLRAAIWVQ